MTTHEHSCPHCGTCQTLPGRDCYPTTANASIPCPGCPRVYYLDCIPAPTCEGCGQDATNTGCAICPETKGLWCSDCLRTHTRFAHDAPTPHAAREAAQLADEAEMVPTCDTCTSPTLPLFVTVYSNGSQRRECLGCRVPRLKAERGTCVDCGASTDLTLRNSYPDVDFGPDRCSDCGWADLERQEQAAEQAALPTCPTCAAYGHHAPDRHPSLKGRIALALTGQLAPMGGGSGDCEHPPARLYTWYAHPEQYGAPMVLCIACCDCGKVLRGGC